MVWSKSFRWKHVSRDVHLTYEVKVPWGPALNGARILHWVREWGRVWGEISFHPWQIPWPAPPSFHMRGRNFSNFSTSSNVFYVLSSGRFNVFQVPMSFIFVIINIFEIWIIYSGFTSSLSSERNSLVLLFW